jgi:hypothetical protein
MLALVLAAALSVAADADTVVMNDGTRISGTVVEENPATGVTIQADDGTIRRLDRKDVARVEFADGTRSTVAAAPEAQAAPPPPPAPRAAPAPAPAPPPRVDGPLDTVYFLGGGRVRGVVLEESPRDGVTIRLLDGSVRTYARSEIQKIQYADGSVSRRREAPPRPPPAYRPAPPPAPEPVPVPASPRHHRNAADPGPLYLAAGLGGTFFGGESEAGVDMDRIFEPQAHFALETGLRLTPTFAVGVYGDVGAGDPAREQRDICRTAGFDCFGSSARIGFLLRGTFNPSAPVSQWVSVGTGWEMAQISADDSGDSELFTYTGREYLRLGGGFDFRGNGVVGVGFYGNVGWGEFRHVEDEFGTKTRLDDELHTTVQVGVRLTLFP